MKVRAWLLTLALVAGGAGARAQSPGDSLVISVLTMGPGREMFERFGHISIRVHDLRTGTDTAYNWGMFDFNQPRFLVRFLTGDTRYWMQGFPTRALLDYYREAGRWVVEQELGMRPAQKDSLRRFIERNALEDNKWYRYDYYRDNCSTRVRDAIDLVLGGAFKRAVDAREHGVTYRSETMRLALAYPLINFGMDFALGRPADATISAWEEMFVPMRVREALRDVRVHRADGTAGRLVVRERVLVADDRYAEAFSPPDQFWPALGTGLGVAGALLILSLLTARSRRARWGIAAIGISWHALAGLAGLLLLCAGLFTRHVFMARNDNLLLATPASLALAVLIPFALARVPHPRIVGAVRSLGVLAAVAALVAVAVRLVPALSQENRALLALAVPIQLSLAFALWRATADQSAARA
ncbi:MAG: DUF4105 domain-containing protein [Gemmatimonadales bacterium]